MIYLNGQPISVTMFPDRTSQVWKIPNIEKYTGTQEISWVFENEAEFLHLAQLKVLLDSYHYRTFLTLKYLPYGRQDKHVSNDATFALAAFAKLLNSLNFSSVLIHDPHSEIALNLINNSSAFYPQRKVSSIAHLCESDLICYPDRGALEKYTKNCTFAQAHIYGQKVRDQSTGNITSYSLYGECYGKNVLIVDDICDGGMTFKLLARDLLAAGAKSVVLFVTHGIFSKGLQTLKDSGIQKIFTQDGEAVEEDGRITYRRL